MYRQHFDDDGRPFAIVGDMQRTSWPERWLLGREQNDGARHRIAAAVAAASPAFVVLLGDVVFCNSRAHWAHADTVMTPWRDLPVLPAVGNHDYWGFCGAREIERRFAQLTSSHWYRRKHGRLMLLWLDSNKRFMSRARWRAQQRFVCDALADADADAAIGATIVFVHHPPFTNSTVTGDATQVGKAFVEPFMAARKTIAMISGHVHAYEHFARDGKHFLVAGGAGGPRVPLDGRHTDLYNAPWPRPFHFIVVSHNAREADFSVRGLDGIIDSFSAAISCQPQLR